MNKKLVENLSLWQLAVLMFIFEIGSVAIVGVGNDSKQDAWIAVAISTVLGVGVISFYVLLLKRTPGKNLFEIITLCFGKWLGKGIALLYVFYFFYIAERVLRDFCELITTVIFENTPIEVISITMMCVIAYMLYLGLEVFGRTGEIFIPYVFTFTILIGLAILFSGEMDFKNLQPVMAEGIGPIFKHIFPRLLTFPYGELITFMVIIPNVTQFKKAGKVSVVTVLVSGMIIIYGTIVEIATLGTEQMERSVFPLLSAARDISLLEFIERVDLVVVFIVMFGIITKVSVFFYAGLKGLEHVMNIPYRYMVLPMSTILSYGAILISNNFAEHIEEGIRFIPQYMHIPFQLILPVLIAPLLFWKTKKQKRGSDMNESQ
ncbi:endospore germination permease [Robertmurraya massiliosenegalensis]|uniref:GerAB/ArcD/ProY family transporter n=1 Tax=Robertmurraya TaxID=2837507 RepID=UPI0039A65EEB